MNKSLSENDFCRAADTLACDVAAIKAVADVESGGSGFLSDGRIKLLFEGHVFHRYTKGKFAAGHPDLCYPKWTRAFYAGGKTADIRGAGELKRFERARTLDPRAALLSASYGRFQIMGFNHAVCGYATVEEFFDALCAGEARQLQAFCEFLRHSGLSDELRDQRWADFARRYNGPEYWKNRYDQKLAAAYQTHSQPKIGRAAVLHGAAAQGVGRPLDAVPDRVDLRDWFYQPTLATLPDTLVNCEQVPEILDQGQEGACTGFALGAVINFLLQRRGAKHRVSPRMLYEMARRYDEWPGEDYEGSSARGAIKGWVRHGVCARVGWPDTLHGPEHFDPARVAEALAVPGGAYYRIKPQAVRDVHAALNETGIVYLTLMVHAGWHQPGPTVVNVRYRHAGRFKTRKIPVITRQGRADGGHAVALVGYTRLGFIVQNSWGERWGGGGFALLPYEDYLIHATDVWVAQLGVPLALDLWQSAGKGGPDSRAGLAKVAGTIPLEEIRPYMIDVGNNGQLSDAGNYWTTETDLRRLFTETLPEQTKAWSKRRVLLYLHGGLNGEEDCAKRVVAMREVLLENQIYPLHIMWETGFMETLRHLAADWFTQADERSRGVGDVVANAWNRVFEHSLAKPGGAVWGEMKENARLACEHARGLGAIQRIAACLSEAQEARGAKVRVPEWELHVIAHSAGSILFAHALPFLANCGVALKSVQFFAPAIRCDLFKQRVMPAVKRGECPLPSLYVLSDAAERDDNVAQVYRQSLLYLVSNAFEGRREVPLLGMEHFIRKDAELKALFSGKLGQHAALIVAGQGTTAGSQSASDSHGGFDNDPDSMNSALLRLLNGKPKRAFTQRDLDY